MNAHTSVGKEDMFFNDEHLNSIHKLSDSQREAYPGYHYYLKTCGFIETHLHVGEKYMEYLKLDCGACQLCAGKSFIGEPCSRIPQPYPDYDASGYHYLGINRY